MDERSYPFPTFSGLLTPNHKERIGAALWEFLWCVDRTTKEVERDGQVYGIVLGGKPIKAEEMAVDLGGHPKNIKRNLQKLADEGYIELKRAPYGQIIEVRKSKKFISRGNKNVTSGWNENVTSEDGDGTNLLPLKEEMDENAPSGSNKNVPSNKTLQKDFKKQQLIGENEQQGIGGVPSPGPVEPGRNTNPYETRPETLPVRDHFHKRTGRANLTIEDIKTLNELLDEGVSVETICLGIDYKVAEYVPKHSADKIRSLKYCAGKIKDLHYALVQTDEAKNQASSGLELTKKLANEYGWK